MFDYPSMLAIWLHTYAYTGPNNLQIRGEPWPYNPREFLIYHGNRTLFVLLFYSLRFTKANAYIKVGFKFYRMDHALN